jgi:hypothetical protein
MQIVDPNVYSHTSPLFVWGKEADNERTMYFYILLWGGGGGGDTSAQDKVGCLDGKKNAYSSNEQSSKFFYLLVPVYTSLTYTCWKFTRGFSEIVAACPPRNSSFDSKLS